jgi:hypothetical protein
LTSGVTCLYQLFIRAGPHQSWELHVIQAWYSSNQKRFEIARLAYVIALPVIYITVAIGAGRDMKIAAK